MAHAPPDPERRSPSRQGPPVLVEIDVLRNPVQVECPDCEAIPYADCTKLGQHSIPRIGVHYARERHFRELKRTGGVIA